MGFPFWWRPRTSDWPQKTHNKTRPYLPRALSCQVMAPLQLCPAAGLYPDYALAQPHSHTQQPQGLILAQTCGSTSQLVTDLSHHYIIALQCGLLVGPGHHFQVCPAPRLTNESTCEKMKGRKSREWKQASRHFQAFFFKWAKYHTSSEISTLNMCLNHYYKLLLLINFGRHKTSAWRNRWCLYLTETKCLF